MQCTSYVPVYYHAKDLNVGASGFPWHLFDSNANYGEERGYNISVPLCNMDQYLGYDKEVLRQIIQNHEATFRYQVQELHRLYRRQKELMDEIRAREIFAQHLLSQTSESTHSWSHAQSEFSQKPLHATSWLVGDLSCNKLSELTAENIFKPSNSFAENFQARTAARPSSFITKSSYNDVKFLSSSSKGNENRIVDLELPSDVYHDDQGKQFKEGNLSQAPKKLPNFQSASDSDINPVKTEDLSSFDLNSRKTNCFIDLNEPVQIESLPSSSYGPFETCHSEIMQNDQCVSAEAIPESVVPNRSGLLNCDGSLDGINSSVAIDLNSMPVNCFSETEMTSENLQSMSKETTVVLDCSSTYDHATKNGRRVEGHPVVHDKIHDKFLKSETYIDLNTGMVDEHSLPLSSSIPQIKSAEDTELEGPVSPENEECSPPRGKSEDIQLETPLLSEKGEGEPSMELGIIAAQTLVMISSSEAQAYMKASTGEPSVNFRNHLRWFAEIASSTGDDLENEIMKLQNDAADNDQGEALNFFHVNEEKGTCSSSSRSGKGRMRETKQCNDFQTEVLPSLTSLETSPLRRKAGRKACAKPRKYSKLSPSDVVKKSMSSILKQPATRSKEGVLQGWGKIKKRQGGCRRRATEFLLIS